MPQPPTPQRHYPYRRPSRTHLPLYISGGAFIALSIALFVLLGLAVATADSDSDLQQYGFLAVIALMPCGFGLPLLLLGAIVHASGRRTAPPAWPT